MNLVSMVPFRIVPPMDGGRALTYGSCKALSRRVSRFLCIAVTNLKDRRLDTTPPFPYREIRSWSSLLIGLERTGLFPNVPYLETFRFLARPLARACAAAEADVVEVSFPWLMPVRRALPASVKVVLVMQNVEAVWYEPSIAARCFPGFFRRRLHTLERRGLELADHVVTLTEKDRQELTQRYGVPPHKTTAIPAGYDPAMFHPPARPAAKRERVRAAFVGSRYSANRRCLQAICSRIAPACKDRADILVAGTVGDRFDSARLPPNVRLLGFVEDLPGFLGSCDVFLNPTPMVTGINTKVIEALACGLRVISTPEGSRGYEPLTDGPIRTVPLDRVAGELLEATRLTYAEQERVADFEWDRVAERRLDLYAGF